MRNFSKFIVLIFVANLGMSAALAADEYNCGRIKDIWPPALPASTGTTCLLNVVANSPQEAFELCTIRAAAGKNCCVDNVVHKNIKGLAVIKGTQVTHIACPGT